MANRDVEIESLKAQISRLTSASTKLEVPKLKGFEGKPDDVAPFLRRLDTYFSATNNDTIDDQRKIAYAVTLIDNESDAFYWKEQHFHEEEKAVANRKHRFATWEEFKTAFKKAFPVYAEGDKALMLLIKTKQGRTPTTAFVPKFRTLAAKANVTDEKTLAGLFKTAVRPELLGKMLNIENPPDTMEKWYDLVLRLDSRQVYGVTSSYDGGGSHYQPTGRGSGRLDEPMDIDHMDIKERQRHQELGLCFGCHKQGHLFRNCLERNKKRERQSPPRQKKTTTPAYVRGMFQELPVEERAALFEELSTDF